MKRVFSHIMQLLPSIDLFHPASPFTIHVPSTLSLIPFIFFTCLALKTLTSAIDDHL